MCTVCVHKFGGVCVMSRDVRKVTYLTNEEAAQLSEWAEETGKSESHLLREAVREYLDQDHSARVEERLGRIEDELADLTQSLGESTTHTHKQQPPMNPASDSTERVREIVRRLQSNHDEVLKDDAVVRAIEDIAGVDDRTVRKYKRLMRKRGLLFEHPGSTPVWTFETDQWLQWMRDFAELNGGDAAQEIADDYPATVTLTPDGYHIEAIEEDIQQ